MSTDTKVIPLEKNKKDQQQSGNNKSEPILLNSKVISPSSAKIADSTKFQIKTNLVESADELIDILEGKDTDETKIEHDNIHVVQMDKNNENNENLKKFKNNCEGVLTILSKDEERMIALEQISNFSSKKKNKTENSTPNLTTSADSSELDETKAENDDIVNEIYHDWSDNEKETTLILDTSENKINIKSEKKVIKKSVKQPTQQMQIKSEQQITPERIRRIVKKKIIWDPDAPETTISYASLVKKINKKNINKPTTNLRSSPKKPLQSNATKQNANKVIAPEPKEKAEIKQDISVTKILNKVSKKIVKKPIKEPESPDKKTIKEVESSEDAKRKRKTIQQITGHIVIGSKQEDDKTPPIKVQKIERPTKEEKVDKILIDDPTIDEKGSPNKRAELLKKDVNGLAVTKKRTAAGEKKSVVKGRKRSDTTWDFIKQQAHNDDAMIARRRSNSSYSSTTSPRRLSLELSSGNQKLMISPKQIKKKSEFEFTKPNNKKKKTNEIDNSTIADDIKPTTRKSKRNTTPTAVQDVKKSNEIKKLNETKKSNDDDPKEIEEDFLTVLKMPKEKLAHIILNLQSKNNKYNIQVMQKITNQLEDLKLDINCNAVIISSVKGQSFCQGLELNSLIVQSIDKRKKAAQELSNTLKLFILTLASFPKILIAGITGEINNLGVMILPAFDIVIAVDSCLFKTNYTNLGYLPENYCIFSESISNQSLKTKLLYLNEPLKCADAILCGLITKSLPQSKFEDAIIETGKKVSSMSQQALLVLKQQKFDVKKISEKLDEEQKVLILQWASTECQENFKI